MQRDLEKLQKLVVKMATLVEESVFLATKALQERDEDLADKVVDNDNLIDRLENDVQDECLKMLALHQPVAVDLRRICSVLQISTDLERMGDLATAIAERSELVRATPLLSIPDRVKPMTERTVQMVRRSLDAFVNLDVPTARAVIKLDHLVDADNKAIIADLIAEMKAHQQHIDAALSLFSAVRHIERIADHATNIAEDVIYVVDGEQVRHKKDSLDEAIGSASS
jgi:phosphate transport system protein